MLGASHVLGNILPSRGTVSNQNTHLPVFEICVFRVYLRNHLSYKKVFYIYLHLCLKNFPMKKEFFRSGHKISWYFQKGCFARKSKLLEKNPPFWKIQNLFSMDLIEFTYKQVFNSKIITQHLQVRLIFYIHYWITNTSVPDNQQMIPSTWYLVPDTNYLIPST